MKVSIYPAEKIKKLAWTAIFIVYAGIIFYASIHPVQEGVPIITVPGADKLIHAGEFTLFTLIGYKAISYYTESDGRYRSLITLSFFYGGLTELVQIFFHYRTASVLDWFADIFGIGFGLIVILLIDGWRKNQDRNYTEPPS
ncbi:VanZ family protein [Candidatus Bipolaricaulota bacterium]|nr:VanZ family protein [Candidatus Bipolaricaulota bacterium]